MEDMSHHLMWKLGVMTGLQDFETTVGELAELLEANPAEVKRMTALMAERGVGRRQGDQVMVFFETKMLGD